MNSHKTQGIVIKRSNYGEADKILTIFTERFGKVKAIAKGVRKIKSKMAGSLEPFMLLNLQLHEGKTFYIVTGAVIEKEFYTLSNDLKKTSQCFFLGELIDQFLEENQKSTSLFNTFLQAIDWVSKNDRSVFFWYFCFKIIEKSGFRPGLFDCIHCHKKLLDEQNFWDSVEGGVICQECQSKVHHGIKIGNETIKILRLMDGEKVNLLDKLKIRSEVLNEVKKILEEYLSSILEKEPRSKSFLREMEGFANSKS